MPSQLGTITMPAGYHCRGPSSDGRMSRVGYVPEVLGALVFVSSPTVPPMKLFHHTWRLHVRRCSPFSPSTLVLPCRFLTACRDRRRVRSHQLRDRRADTRALPGPGRHSDQRFVLDRRRWRSPADHPAAGPHARQPAIGWRLAFGLGAILALGVLIVRRHVPESPRWLFIHGREEDGERIVAEIEERVSAEDQVELPEPSDTITVRQRRSIGMGLIAALSLHALSAAYAAVLRALRRPGLLVQRLLLHLRGHTDDIPRGQADRLVHRHLRGQQLPRRVAAQPAVRHRRPRQDDRRHLHLSLASCSP